MKNTVLAVCMALMIIGCSSDDDNGNNGPVTGDIYLPLATDNYWTYDVEGSAPGRDSLYVAEDVVISGATYKKMETENVPFGFFSGSLKGNGARYADGAVMVSGNAGLNLGEAFPVEIALSNFVILRENAAANSQLSSVSGEITQVYDGYPLLIEYTLKSTAKETLENYTSPNGESYQDVKAVELTLNMSISSTIDLFGFPVTIPILAAQDVVVSKNYFSKNIGMVYTNTVISYELEDFSQAGFTLPIPQSGSDTQQEFLATYSVE